ncbi:nucleotide pyrophosphohydrolase [Arthrobacter sp. B0490]|uniref:nucleotide pyrophosphohydrolase n=1 Tax=Arthrobacter sp. B0490 TaxID=2058891 RepID=UPI000CE568AB|nr:nucleotide pyrophosphohydrolase [Arthrobacter sp. B0490]
MESRDTGQILASFAARRNWGVHHLPRSVLLALVREVGEAAELLQWVPDNQVSHWLDSDDNRDRFAGELADVSIYLHYLAQSTGVDLDEAVAHKIRVNEQRFPEETGSIDVPGDRTTSP